MVRKGQKNRRSVYEEILTAAEEESNKLVLTGSSDRQIIIRLNNRSA